MAAFYDVFNGDADGLCALHQLRLATPRASVLITGVKRDIALLERVDARAGDELTVLDISLRHNLVPLRKLLARGAHCLYFDHHFPGTIPTHANFQSHIDTSADVCTSLLVDRYLQGRARAWAVVAAFGDNLERSARDAATPLELSARELDVLCELGACLNYNAYGEQVEDLNYHPADLYSSISRYRDPFDFINSEPVLDVLRVARADDLSRASEIKPEYENAYSALYLLPNQAWSRRVSGTLANRLAQGRPDRAHAVLVSRADGYTVSVRAPLNRPTGADRLCREFANGGGRQGAAGIERLLESDLQRFVSAFARNFDPARSELG